MTEEKQQYEQADDLFDKNRFQEVIDLLKTFKVSIVLNITYY